MEVSFRFDYTKGKVVREVHNHFHPKNSREHLTLEKAEADKERYEERRKKAQAEAKTLLDKYETMYKALPFRVSYHMEGDTHGIYEDYSYIGVTVDGFNFERRLDD